MRLSDARAVLPSLKTEIWKPNTGAYALRKLADWCQRYTPTVGVYGEDGLWLDVAGAAHFYGDEAGLLNDLSVRLRRLGFAHQLGLAETPGLAWAMARFAASDIITNRIVLSGGQVRALTPLPLAALRLDEATLYLLKRFGLQTVGQLLTMPRASLKRRFPSSEVGEAVVERLDQALGYRAEPLDPLRRPPLYTEHILSPEPIVETESFTRGLNQLLARLCRRLEQDLKGATALTFSAYRGDGGVSHIDTVTARPSRDVDHLMRLFADKIAAIDPGFGVDHLRLSVSGAERLDAAQLTLNTNNSGGYDEAALAPLLDRLASRLGPDAVQRGAFRASHIPERAEYRTSAVSSRPSTETNEMRKPPRPLRLLSCPEPVEVLTEIPEGAPKRFTWRRVVHHVRRAEGPERIAPEWWRHMSIEPRHTRDYYRLEDEKGQQFWLFRSGFYGDQEHLPTWHLHGLYT